MNLVQNLANELIQFKTNGLCQLGKVCEDCDCFADVDNGKLRDQYETQEVQVLLNWLNKNGYKIVRPPL